MRPKVRASSKLRRLRKSWSFHPRVDPSTDPQIWQQKDKTVSSRRLAAIARGTSGAQRCRRGRCALSVGSGFTARFAKAAHAGEARPQWSDSKIHEIPPSLPGNTDLIL